MMMAVVFTSTINFVLGRPSLPLNFALVLPSFTSASCHRYTIEPPKALSPLVVNSLLLKLNALGYTAQAYEDDLAIVIQGKHLNTVTDLMQGSLRVVDS